MLTYILLWLHSKVLFCSRAACAMLVALMQWLYLCVLNMSYVLLGYCGRNDKGIPRLVSIQFWREITVTVKDS